MDMAEIGQQVLGTLLPIIGSALTAALSYVAMYIGKKYKLDIITTNEDAMRLQIRRGIRGAEEMAARKLQVKESFEGKDKAALVVNALRKQFPKLGQSEAMRMLDQELAYMDGMGASGPSVGVRPEDKRVPEANASVTVHNGVAAPVEVEAPDEEAVAEAPKDESPASEEGPSTDED